ncbi:MAG: PRTRC system protein B [Chloroflexi bacterium]|nr:MAG: PRTRC system protein B [Chloroflexota bacterium]
MTMRVYNFTSPSSPSPRLALVFHQAEGGALLVTRHPVVEETYLGPGSLLSLDAVEEIASLLAGVPTTRELLPENVLLSRPTETAWYVPGRVRPMWFRTGNRTVSLTVPWPTLVFHARNDRLRVCALSCNKRPAGDTPVHHAPLMNIYADGTLCLGNVTPSSCGLSGMQGWEAAVFDSHFTHTNHDQALRPPHDGNEGHFRFWRRLGDRQARTFPARSLVPRGQTLAQFLSLGGSVDA